MGEKMLTKIDTIELFPEINRQLIQLLKSLTLDDWNKKTVLSGRTVKDIASHILDGSLRKLSIQRDNHCEIESDLHSYKDLVNFIQELNKTWIEASKRLSPQVLISLLEISENWFYEFIKTLDQNDKAIFSVAWAGEKESKNWFDTAREYTEKWHHQAQIRLAVDKPGISSKRLLFPVLDTFMRGCPYAYKNIQANGAVKVEITGEACGVWYIENIDNQWMLVTKPVIIPATIIKLPDEIAWRLFTDSIDKKEAEKQIHISGNKNLARPLLDMTAVMR